MRQRLPFDPIAEARRHWESHGWTDAAPGMAAVTSVMRAQQILLARIDEELRTFGLTFARFELLRLLAFSSKGSLPLVVIGSRLQVHPTSVTSVVDRLEEQGLVRRTPHPTDRRVKLAELTDEGSQRVEDATERLNETVFSFPGLTVEEIEQLVTLLTRLRSEAGDF